MQWQLSDWKKEEPHAVRIHKRSLLLYAGQPAAQHYETLIPAAIQEVERMLLPMADPGDPRLEQLAAALCNQRLQELEAPRDRAACTYAGTIAQQTDSTQKLAAADRLVQDTKARCRDLLRDDTFAFFSC